MVATRALSQAPQNFDTEADLRRCVRDLVSLSSLPELWIKADAKEIADGLAQLIVSVLDADIACVVLPDPDLEVIHVHDRLTQPPIELLRVRQMYRPNAQFEIVAGDNGRLRAICVPIGQNAGSGLVVLSGRPDFPNPTEQVLMRVAANQAATAIQRWKAEARQAEQARALEKLNEIEKALYGFTDRLFRASSRGEIYDAGLNAISRILHSDRAAIALFDDPTSMCFVAWRGLSEEYRKEIECHPPRKLLDQADPIWIDDIREAEIPDRLAKAVGAEAIAAMAWIPIFVGGKIAGKFMVCYDAPQSFPPNETDAGITIARQLGSGLERLRSEEVMHRLATIVDTSDDAIISKNLDGIILTWNDGASRVFGYTAQEVIGKPVTILMPPERVDEEPGILARLRRGERIEHYETIRRRKDGTLIDVSLTVSPLRDKAGNIIGASKIARDISDRKRVEATKELLVHEIKHRVKNTLANVQAIARQSLRSCPIDERETFIARIRAYAEVHDILTQKNWHSADVREVVARALNPFRYGRIERFHVSGESRPLDPNNSLLLAMVLHELATNAVKYGSLSNNTGTVNLDWRPAGEDGESHLILTWREQGGPEVSAPTRRGFGSLLIEHALRAEHGDAQLAYAPDGLSCTLRIPPQRNPEGRGLLRRGFVERLARIADTRCAFLLPTPQNPSGAAIQSGLNLL